MSSPLLPMTQEEHLLLNEVIERQFGLSFPQGKRDALEARLRPRLQALRLKRFIDYYLLLQYDFEGELEHLARVATNNETYFFREAYQFESLFSDELAALSETAGHPSYLRLLCAGCSSGEEAYSLSLCSMEASPRLRCRIDAFDIDVDCLDKARRAVYGSGSLRSTSEEQKKRYFAERGPALFELKKAYRERVSFAFGNAVDLESFQKPELYDVVFCRNVLIYFSEGSFLRTILNFSRVLRLGGLLFLGHSESIIGRTRCFETVRLSSCIAYRKVEE